ncbi:MAG: 1-acyl-sn-glycerol-3-phosphate acyltransferase [Rhodocyclaceae bacterium]|nr:1-acyl-sn-glycerol-3-phosphate acyltransferase [Rhodocyclaceae bacterium]
MKLLQILSRMILRLFGWTLLDIPQRPPKSVVIAYPHTSNWDFPLALLALAGLPFQAQWVGKDTMFRWPFAGLLRLLGGVAVNRRERTGFVDLVVDEFESRNTFHLLIAAEGTRNRQEGWKSGFYRMAMAANVPVLLSVMDYSRRELGLLAAIELTGDETADMERIAKIYEGRKGHRHELASPIRLI